MTMTLTTRVPTPVNEPASVRTLLSEGELRVLGRIPTASNLALVCEVHADGQTRRCIYKPVLGEVPLWDFPDGTLAGREVAARLVDAALGWGLIPETVLRADGPVDTELGPGMVQDWIEQPAEPDGLEPVEIVLASAIPEGYVPILRAQEDDGTEVAVAHATDPVMRRLAVLDAVLNNADRKGGHILVDGDGRLYGIDHGLTLHSEPKLRTILWGWAGEPVDDELRGDLARLAAALEPSSSLVTALTELITQDEVAALRERVVALSDGAPLPHPPNGRAIPWPPF